MTTVLTTAASRVSDSYSPGVSSGSYALVSPDGTATNKRGSVVAVPRDQMYYWTRSWQENEAAAVAELERGEGRRFTTATDAIRWLLSDED